MRNRSGFGWIEFISGLCMLLLGIFTIFRPESMFTWLVAVYGLLAIITGVCDIVFYIKTERYTGFCPIIALISGILSVMAGAVLLAHPGMGKWILAVLFPLWFIAHCISRLMHLDMIRFTAGRTYCYISLVINVLGLILGIMMLVQPIYSFIAVGTLVGIYLIASGLEKIVIAFSRMGSGW